MKNRANFSVLFTLIDEAKYWHCQIYALEGEQINFRMITLRVETGRFRGYISQVLRYMVGLSIIIMLKQGHGLKKNSFSTTGIPPTSQ
jgi:hypothetical protein